MTEDKERLLQDFESKIVELIAISDRTRSEVEDLKSKINNLKHENAEKDEQLAKMAAQIENLKMSLSLVSGENIHEAKIKLNKLLREVDRCIALFNKVN